jgi:soluble lytic murein transglycosylase
MYRSISGDGRAPLYYRLLADVALSDGTLSDVTPANKTSASLVFNNSDRDDSDDTRVETPFANALRSLVSWHLEDRVYSVAAKICADCPPSLARELASALQKAGHYDDAIRLVLMAVSNSGGALTQKDLESAYPRPYLHETSAAAKRFDMSEYILYALIRSESYFDAGVKSTVGAHGLTQLMDPTAADIARKLKIAEFDLADPETNITFGAHYLAELTRRLDGNSMAALWAYNAGITRVREWIAAVPAGDTDLLLEGLPYAETREYGRKVLAAAAVYGYLYYQKPAAEIVRELF